MRRATGLRRLQRLRRLRSLLLGACACALAAPAAGHPLAPSLLELRERAPGRVQVLWRTPLMRVAGSALEPVLPEGCAPRGEAAVEREEGSLAARWEIACPAEGLVGQSLAVRGLGESQSSVLVRVELADGRSLRRVLRAGQESLVIPSRTRARDVARDYVRMGAGHIAGGLDHLAFVLGLVLLVPPGRKLLATITAFTAGHSLTLALAALGHLRIPPAPAEALIAASILAVAVELARPGGAGQRHPVGLAAGFGLVHGLGFAGALAQVGLPDGEIPLALAAFNVGIELGQLAFVAGLLALAALGARAPRPRGLRLRLVPAYAIGALAAFWLWERIAVLV